MAVKRKLKRVLVVKGSKLGHVCEGGFDCRLLWSPPHPIISNQKYGVVYGKED